MAIYGRSWSQSRNYGQFRLRNTGNKQVFFFKNLNQITEAVVFKIRPPSSNVHNFGLELWKQKLVFVSVLLKRKEGKGAYQKELYFTYNNGNNIYSPDSWPKAELLEVTHTVYDTIHNYKLHTILTVQKHKARLKAGWINKFRAHGNLL